MAGSEGKGTEVVEEKSYWGMEARVCDTCRSTPALLFCRTHSAFLCGPCDTRVHAFAATAAPHERVWMCEVCEQEPAAFTCKADAATLCIACDADIHSANLLARRHYRVPVVPFFHSHSDLKATAADFLLNQPVDYEEGAADRLTPAREQDPCFFSERVDCYLDLDQNAYSSVDREALHRAEIVVPAAQDGSLPAQPPVPLQIERFDGGHDLDHANSSRTTYSNYPPSLGHSASSGVGVVPEGSTATDTTTFSSNSPHDRCGLTHTAVATVATGTDREARVMRYREKRKNRKFEKTIRYASRKAYAETRPRVKGRFVKRTEQQREGAADVALVDSLYASSNAAVGAPMVDTVYGVVSSF